MMQLNQLLGEVKDLLRQQVMARTSENTGLAEQLIVQASRAVEAAEADRRAGGQPQAPRAPSSLEVC